MNKRASSGKIARLPHDIREQLNQRIRDGKSGPDILTWLNDIPVVKEILAAQFKGKPVNSQNLSNWRTGATGYKQWLEDKLQLDEFKYLGQWSLDIVQSGSGNIPQGAVAIASAQVLKLLRKIARAENVPEDIVKYAAATATLLRVEQSNTRIGIARERLRQRDDQLVLTRNKHQRDVVGVALRVLGDARAKAIEAADFNNSAKIELLGRHLFGVLWESRPVPEEPAAQSSNL